MRIRILKNDYLIVNSSIIKALADREFRNITKRDYDDILVIIRAFKGSANVVNTIPQKYLDFVNKYKLIHESITLTFKNAINEKHSKECIDTIK